MTSPLWEVTPGTPGVRREFLDYVADIANVLAHQNGTQRQPTPHFDYRASQERPPIGSD